MILFLTARGHEFGVKTLVEHVFPDLPECRTMCYEDFFLAVAVPVATYVFCDIDRLATWETRIAAERYRKLKQAGMRCLNDPARVMNRFELLRKLFRKKFNPFNVYQAALRPKPKKFPVFVRSEEHRRVGDDLIPDQAALDRKLRSLRAQGNALRDLIVVEFATEPIAPGVWRRLGTFRIGDGFSVDSSAIENRWRVSDGTKGLATDAMIAAEADEVRSNRLAEAVRPAFETAGIEWGRADHTTVNGREIVFEINTNPTIHPIAGQSKPLREETLIFSRARMAAQLRAIDTAANGTLELPLSPFLKGLGIVEARTISRP